MEWNDPQIILSTVVAIATVFYTGVNVMMWYESRKTRKQETTPNIIAFLQSTANKEVLALHIKNIGKGCAKNVKAKIVKDYHIFEKEETLSYFKMFSEGVNIYPPNYELHFYLDFWNTIRKECCDGYVELELEYSDMEGKIYRNNVFKLPFIQIASNYSTPPDNTEELVPYYLKEINKTLKAIRTK